MNQRFQNAEIRYVSSQYADDALYRAMQTIGMRLEAELTEFGMCAEECFVETLEILSHIAVKGNEADRDMEALWLCKYNEYRRYDRHVADEEIRKAVGIVFGFAVLALDSSRHPFYRSRLSETMVQTIAIHKFDGWTNTLARIFDVPLEDGWFDHFIEQSPDDGDGDVTEFAKGVSAIRQQIPNAPINIQYVNNQYNSDCQQFMGRMDNPRFYNCNER